MDLKFNKIIDLLEVSNLKGSIYELDLRGNSCVKWPNYRDVIVFSIPNIMFIDGVEVSITEKVQHKYKLIILLNNCFYNFS